MINILLSKIRIQRKQYLGGVYVFWKEKNEVCGWYKSMVCD